MYLHELCFPQVWVSCSSVRLVESSSRRSLEDNDDDDDNEDEDDDYSLYTEEDYAELEHAFEFYWDALDNNVNC